MVGRVPRSLAGIPPDPRRVFRVRDIVFSMVRDRCREIGLREGDLIRCVRRTSDGVEVKLPSGQVTTVARMPRIARAGMATVYPAQGREK